MIILELKLFADFSGSFHYLIENRFSIFSWILLQSFAMSLVLFMVSP